MPSRCTRTLAALALAACALPASAAIPATERQALIDLYNSTHGDAWTVRAGWKTAGSFSAAGSECGWNGITCNADKTRVTRIALRLNNLAGTLPDTLNQLTALEYVDVSNNSLTGAIPDIGALTALRILAVDSNQLTGAIPELGTLVALTGFYAYDNQLTGAIPELGTLTALQVFNVNANQLTGTIPDISGLTALERFWASSNQLSGAIPDISGLTALEYFDVDANQLTGTIPDLGRLAALKYFHAHHNQLTGPIPDIRGLAALEDFDVFDNRLTGAIPDISRLTALQYFGVGGNRLTGAIPDISALIALEDFSVFDNQLTGPIPDISGLAVLRAFYVDHNQLTGIPPDAPAHLLSDHSALCPNYLGKPSNTDSLWNAATGGIWSADCTDAPTYTATASTGSGGSISPASRSGAPGDKPTFTVTPDAGMAVDQVSSTCGQPTGQPALLTPGPLSSFTTAALIADCTVTVSFKVAPVTSVPTLGQWALSVMGLLLAALGLRRAGRR
ncbi:MAG: IPTL-CTERM sorting domain-containing protein [Microbacterium sp.]